MSEPIIVPRDKPLKEVLTSGQVHMLIIGSSRRAGDLAVMAGQVSDREEFGDERPRCAVQVTSVEAIDAKLRATIGDAPDPTIAVVQADGRVTSISRDTAGFDRIDLETLFLEAGV
jgi:hypothetical protein